MGGPGRRRLAAVLLLAVLAWTFPAIAARWAQPALVELGPNDADYVTGFRPEGWEREPGHMTRFHWTTPSATVTLPVLVAGDGAVLRLRLRRHFLDPARVRLSVEGRTVSTFDLQADPKVAWPLVEVPLPRLEGRHPFVLGIHAPSDNPRPLGIAIDWIEVEAGTARFGLTPGLRLRLLGLVAGTVAVLLMAGTSLRGALSAGSVALVASCAGVVIHVVAAERILREGLPAYLMAGALAAGAARRWRQPLVAALVLVALAVRLALLLHPQFYYPDVRVHALFAWQLFRRGFEEFLTDFTANQYRFSLGLQFENGHWYAFPYPPAFYILAWPLLKLGYAKEVAVSLVGAIANSLEVLLVFALARRLTSSGRAALAAAAVVPVLPLFTARLALAYFPAIVGHTVDAVVLLVLVACLDRLDRPPVVVGLGALVATALLTYTQSVLNFGLLLPGILLVLIVSDRTPAGRRRQAGLLLAGLLGAALPVAIFYGRYIPVFLEMRRGVPMPEERLLLEKVEKQKPEEEAAPEEPDPYVGSNVDVLRGLRKAAWRMHVFYGPFAFAVVAGLVLLWRGTEGDVRRLWATWAATYVILNLASGGLPGPNLVRYNKDLELVAPLFCTALGVIGLWLAERQRVLGWSFACGFWMFGLWRAAAALRSTIVLERF